MGTKLPVSAIPIFSRDWHPLILEISLKLLNEIHLFFAKALFNALESPPPKFVEMAEIFGINAFSEDILRDSSQVAMVKNRGQILFVWMDEKG